MNNDNNDTMQLADIAKWLEDKKLYLIAERVGLTYPTLLNIKNGSIKDCKMSTIIKLSNYIKASK